MREVSPLISLCIYFVTLLLLDNFFRKVIHITLNKSAIGQKKKLIK